MTWRDQYQQGSFRGVPFSVKASDFSGGRRVALHEYPKRDIPYPEDMGSKAREYRLDALVLGDNYFQARDDLIDVLDRFGPGLLIHPYFGRMQIQVQSWTCHESTAEGGIATFSLEFVEAGAAAEPDIIIDTAEAVDGAATDTETALEESYPDEWDVEGVEDDAGSLLDDALDSIEAARQKVANVTGQINSFVGKVQGIRQRVMNLILAPANLASSILGAVASLRDIAASPMAALAVYRGLFEYGKTMIDPPGNSPAARRKTANRKAMRRLIRTAAVIGAARAIVEAQPYRYVGPSAPFGASTGVANRRTGTVAVADTKVVGFATFQEAVAARDEVIAAIRMVMEDADFPYQRAAPNAWLRWPLYR